MIEVPQIQNAIRLLENFMEISRPLNKEELCEYLKIERSTLEYYNGQGLPRFKIGNEVRYYLPDVLGFFRERGINQKKERFAYEAEVEGQ
jgi:hypothetical protein